LSEKCSLFEREAKSEKAKVLRAIAIPVKRKAGAERQSRHLPMTDFWEMAFSTFESGDFLSAIRSFVNPKQKAHWVSSG